MRLSIIGLLLLTAIPNHATSQHNIDPQGESQTKVMVLGTFHFHKTPDFYDIMDEDKQQELKAVINSLTGFRPDKIALEASYKDSAKIDSLYQRYVAGTHELTNNERQQLGFRLAEKLNHPSVYSIDYKQPWPYGKVMKWAKENKPGYIEFYKNWKKSIGSYQDSLFKHATLRENLKWLNSKPHDDRLHEVRMRTAELGGGSNFVGTKTMASSYERNLKIFSNLAHIAESGDRILVIYGSGHNYFLKEFVEMHPDMNLVEVADYL